MLFTSGEFLFAYLPVVIAGFFLLAALAGRGVAAAWLVLASFVFYGYWRVEHTALLLISIVFNYAVGIWLQQPGHPGTRRGRWILAGGVAVNLAALAYYKYAGFLAGMAGDLGNRHPGLLDIALPIGISFFTFTQIAYLVDSFAGKVRERNPVHYALFVTYFPHLIAGPVLHHAEMMPQFARPEIYRPQWGFLATGMLFFVLGLAKKVLLADSAAPVANDVFDAADPAALGAARVWQGVLAYTLQIYFDFSGYSDMAVGLSLLFGVQLPFNFNSPYKARSIVAFWRCWHMTLSRFLRDYLYVALGGNRNGKFLRYVNLLVTMLLGGLWHGASWTFVWWGALHGAYLMVNHGWRTVRERAGQRFAILTHPAVVLAARPLAWLLTFASVVTAWVFFRAPDVASATQILRVMSGLAGAAPLTAASAVVWGWIVLGLVICVTVPNSQQIVEAVRQAANRLRERKGWNMGGAAFAVGMLAVIASLLVAISASREVSEFIYFNF